MDSELKRQREAEKEVKVKEQRQEQKDSKEAKSTCGDEEMLDPNVRFNVRFLFVYFLPAFVACTRFRIVQYLNQYQGNYTKQDEC